MFDFVFFLVYGIFIEIINKLKTNVMKEKTNYKILKVKVDVHHKLKIKAAQEGIKLESLVDIALNEWLSKKK